MIAGLRLQASGRSAESEMKIRMLAAVVFFLAGCSGGASSSGGGTGEALKPGAAVRVGVVLEFSGPTATYGEETWNGIQMALEDLKGKDPWTIELRRQDNKSDPQETARMVQQLI